MQDDQLFGDIVNMETELIDKLVDAVLWMSGSPSFSPEGEAREGFEKVVRPLLDEYFESKKVTV